MTETLVIGFVLLAGAALSGWDVWRSFSTGIGQWAYFRGFDRRTSPEEYWFVVVLGLIVSICGLLTATFLLVYA